MATDGYYKGIVADKVDLGGARKAIEKDILDTNVSQKDKVNNVLLKAR